MDAAAPQEWTASDLKRPHDGKADPGSRRFSAPGALSVKVCGGSSALRHGLLLKITSPSCPPPMIRDMNMTQRQCPPFSCAKWICARGAMHSTHMCDLQARASKQRWARHSAQHHWMPHPLAAPVRTHTLLFGPGLVSSSSSSHLHDARLTWRGLQASPQRHPCDCSCLGYRCKGRPAAAIQHWRATRCQCSIQPRHLSSSLARGDPCSDYPVLHAGMQFWHIIFRSATLLLASSKEPDVGALRLTDKYVCLCQGNAPVPAGMQSPVSHSPRDSAAAAAEPAAAAVPDAAPTAGSGSAPDSTGTQGSAAGADAVWSSMGGDSAAAAAGASPARGFSADAEQSAGISAAERENMYRMYSQHVEVRLGPLL